MLGRSISRSLKRVRRGKRESYGAGVLVIALLALAVTALGGPQLKGTHKASASSAGTTVGSAQYPVPWGAVVVSPSGDDSAAGTTAAPLRTLGQAISDAASGSTIVLRAGSYHESVVIPSDKRLTIQSWPGEAVWLDGSVPVTSWTASGSRWRAAWNVHLDDSPTYARGAADNAGDWGFVNAAFPMAAHPDQIWIGGVAQRQVSSSANVTPGTFFYDESTNTLWLGTNPSGESVRASDLPTAMKIRSTLSIVRGIGIRRYAPSVPDMGAVTVERSGDLLENVAITDSATTGLHVGSSTSPEGVVLRNVEVTNSGMLGISATYADNITMDQVDVENNNVEHFNTAPVSGGVKIARTRGITVRDSVLSNNDGPGLWVDESSYDIAVTGNDIRNNAKHGISLEISAKATVSDNNVVANGGFGIKVNDTSGVTLTGNTFDANGDRSINIVQDSRTPATSPGRDPRQPFPDPTMTWQVGPVSVRNNVISNQEGGSCMLCVEDYSHQRSAAKIGVTANGDTYVRPNSSAPKYVAVWSRGAGDPSGYTTLASFQSATGQESNGSYDTSSPTTTTPTTAAPTTTEAPTTTTMAPTTTIAPTTTTTVAPVPVPVTPPQTNIAVDDFGRTVANGLGTADAGGDWMLSGRASSFSVANGAAQIEGKVGSNRAAYLGVQVSDVDINADLTLADAPSGGGAYLSLIGRRVSDDTDYRVKVRYMPDGVLAAYLVRTLGGDETILSATLIPGLTVNPGDTLSARFVIGGNGSTTTLGAKLWRQGRAEPADWQISASEATPSALRGSGGVGLLLYTSRSWRHSTPTIIVDNLTAGSYG